MIRDIILWPDNLLHEKSLEVPQVSVQLGSLDELIVDMFDTMYNAGGIGLAAIQVGVKKRIFVMEVTGQDYVFINPIITSKLGYLELKNEGCLSLPGIVEQVERYEIVTVTAIDRNGEFFSKEFRDLEAQCIQHEAEHLDGIVMPDKFSFTKREMMRAQMKKRDKK